MSTILSATRALIVCSLLYCWIPAANAQTNEMLQLRERFPDAVKLHDGGKRRLEFCPDNTCDLFVLSQATSVEVLGDFAFLYLYYFSDYFVLADWRTEEAARNGAVRVLGRYAGKKCAAGAETARAQCILRNLAKRYAIQLYWVRYDEKGRHLQSRSISEATKTKIIEKPEQVTNSQDNR